MSKYEDRINKAVAIASRYAMTYDVEHKQWVIDKMVRALLSESEYNDFALSEDYEWDEGIAP